MRQRARPDLWEPREGYLPGPPDCRVVARATAAVVLSQTLPSSSDVRVSDLQSLRQRGLRPVSWWPAAA